MGWERDFGIVMKRTNTVCYDAFTPSFANIYNSTNKVPNKNVDEFLLPAEEDNGKNYPWRVVYPMVDITEEYREVVAVDAPPDDLPDWYLLNHSSDPTVEIKKTRVSGFAVTRKVLVFFAKKDIEYGDELTYKYETVTAAFAG